MQSLTLKAPAKINLYLQVLNKRADGFHNIETVFEKIDLCDEITLSRKKHGIRVSCQHQDLPQEPKDNLVFKAAEALLLAARCKAGLKISLVKKIPVAAGLGGGSSDAASVLLGLNRFFSLGLNQGELVKIGESLGADVPFFLLSCSRALGEGKGEILTPLEFKKKNWYVLVVPALKVSTQKMYQDLRITLTKRPSSVKIILCALEKGDLTSLNKYSYNSFAPILKRKYKEITQIKKALDSAGACATLLSGSGPCVFGISQTRKEAMRISARLRKEGRNWQIMVARTY